MCALANRIGSGKLTHARLLAGLGLETEQAHDPGPAGTRAQPGTTQRGPKANGARWGPWPGGGTGPRVDPGPVVEMGPAAEPGLAADPCPAGTLARLWTRARRGPGPGEDPGLAVTQAGVDQGRQ